MTTAPETTPTAWTELSPTRSKALAVDDVEPRLYTRPADSGQLAETLRQANEQGLAVIPRGGGTQMELGNPPSRADLVLDTTQLMNVVEYEPADLTVTVEAGMAYADLQALLRAQGQMLALDPPLATGATIGGIIATNASGPLRHAYGTARDLVIGCRVANADGRLTRAGGRVVKNVAGYDLNKLYVGSLGTLGVLVELSFKLHPIPPADAVVVIQLERMDSARQLLRAIVRSALLPMAVELLGATAASSVGLGERICVALRVGGYPPAVTRIERDLHGLAAEHGGRVLDVTYSTWEDVRQLGTPGVKADVLVKAAAPIAQSATLVELLESHLAPFSPLVWAHAGNGVAYASCHAPENAETFTTALVAARAAVAALDGSASLVVERCPSGVKQRFDVWGEVGAINLELMRALKRQLDPRGTLNPGRYVGGI